MWGLLIADFWGLSISDYIGFSQPPNLKQTASYQQQTEAGNTRRKLTRQSRIVPVYFKFIPFTDTSRKRKPLVLHLLFCIMQTYTRYRYLSQFYTFT
jgi:hypothetical protein